ncbi:uncharacterized protein UV8b_03301 [Ustilaginoidea virens]|uniref:Uncharacterized protein n=1 Tax=Ustilaginoidea virens TaxID=1159556 RepID=A0A8E5HP14_USTVR|nr:uncharacterized protein UV8b_03301 [Ustilaginoidea virens]QUC19060.1 hypothetical protein UV8b_03301 [Ustilaginoidea virens]
MSHGFAASSDGSAFFCVFAASSFGNGQVGLLPTPRETGGFISGAEMSYLYTEIAMLHMLRSRARLPDRLPRDRIEFASTKLGSIPFPAAGVQNPQGPQGAMCDGRTDAEPYSRCPLARLSKGSMMLIQKGSMMMRVAIVVSATQAGTAWGAQHPAA